MNDEERLKAYRSQRGRSSKRTGDVVEKLVAARLQAMGFQMIERIETGWRPSRVAGKIVGARPTAKVSGDFRALDCLGRSVLVECKFRPDRLLWSDLAKHQVDALTRHHDCGGLSFLAWLCGHGLEFYRWPIMGFGPGKSLHMGMARAPV